MSTTRTHPEWPLVIILDPFLPFPDFCSFDRSESCLIYTLNPSAFPSHFVSSWVQIGRADPQIRRRLTQLLMPFSLHTQNQSHGGSCPCVSPTRWLFRNYWFSQCVSTPVPYFCGAHDYIGKPRLLSPYSLPYDNSWVLDFLGKNPWTFVFQRHTFPTDRSWHWNEFPTPSSVGRRRNVPPLPPL